MAPPLRPLIAVQDLRDEGLTTSYEPQSTDGLLTKRIADVTRQITDFTGLLFDTRVYPTTAPLVLDGNDENALDLPNPALQLDSVIEGYDSSSGNNGLSLRLEDVIVRGGPDEPLEERLNARLEKRGGGGRFGSAVLGVGAGYSSPGDYGPASSPLVPHARWAWGHGNIALAGVFGFVDGMWRGDWAAPTVYNVGDLVRYGGVVYSAPAGSTGVTPGTDGSKWVVGAPPPPDIKQAALLWVMKTWRPRADPRSAVERRMAQVVSQSTTGHSHSLTGFVASGGPTGDPEIDTLVATYRRPFIGSTRGY